MLEDQVEKQLLSAAVLDAAKVTTQVAAIIGKPEDQLGLERGLDSQGRTVLTIPVAFHGGERLGIPGTRKIIRVTGTEHWAVIVEGIDKRVVCEPDWNFSSSTAIAETIQDALVAPISEPIVFN